MDKSRIRFTRTARVLLLTGAALGLSIAAPAAPNVARPAKAPCPYGMATDGSTNCMTKADFDIAKARQSALDRDPAQYMRNALQRCEGLAGDDRRDCVARIANGSGTTSGSVEGGGIYRELVTRETVPPVPPAASAPASAPQPRPLPTLPSEDKK